MDLPDNLEDSKLHSSLEIMALFDQLHQLGNTIILVTHEDDIAMHAKRCVRLRDGIVESDKKI